MAAEPKLPSHVQPKLSVILIAYNQRVFIREAVESVLRAQAQDIELLCVDDGSTDGTAEALEEYAAADPRVRVVRHSHSGKPAVVRNRGLEIARGDCVCFLDGDDLCHPGRLDAIVTALTAAPAADVLFHDYADFLDGSDPNGAPSRIASTKSLETLEGLRAASLPGLLPCWWLDANRLALSLLADGFVVHTGTICIRRSHIVQRGLRFPEDRIYGEDTGFWLRAIVDARVLYLNRTLTFLRKHASSLTNVRTVEAQRAVVTSLEEMLEVLARRMPNSALHGVRSRMTDEMLEEGWLLWNAGRPMAAMRSYARTAVRCHAPEAVRRIVRGLGALVLRRHPRLVTP